MQRNMHGVGSEYAWAEKPPEPLQPTVVSGTIPFDFRGYVLALHLLWTQKELKHPLGPSAPDLGGQEIEKYQA